MDADVGLEISGLKELEAAFDALGRVGTKAAMTAALRKSVKNVAVDAAHFAPVGKEDGPISERNLARSIKIRTTLSKNQRRLRGDRVGLAEVFIGSTDPKAHLIEFGHAVKSRGPHRRGSAPTSGVSHVPARPFMRPAWDMHRRDISKKFGKLIWDELVRVARRYRKQAERGKLSRGGRVALSGEGK